MMPLNVNLIRIGIVWSDVEQRLSCCCWTRDATFSIPMSSVSVHEMIIIFHRNSFLVGWLWIILFSKIVCARHLNSTPQLANVIAYLLVSHRAAHHQRNNLHSDESTTRNRLGYCAKTNTRRCIHTISGPQWKLNSMCGTTNRTAKNSNENNNKNNTFTHR